VVLDLVDPARVALSATPAPAKVPHNPAIEDNQIKVFVDMEVI